MILAFAILADYQIENLGKIASDIYLLTVILYLVVLVEGLILSVRKLKERAREIDQMKNEIELEQRKELEIRSNRKQVLLPLDKILFVESRGDYVEIHSQAERHMTKEKISSLEDRLPSSFIRIHRSFIVNKNHVSGYNSEAISVQNSQIPIGRKYKKATVEFLRQNIIA